MSDRPTEIEMNLDGRPSRFVLGPLAGLELPRYVPAPPPVYLVDRRVAELHAEWLGGIQAGCPRDPERTLVIEGGEGAKTPARLHEVWQWLAAAGWPATAPSWAWAAARCWTWRASPRPPGSGAWASWPSPPPCWPWWTRPSAARPPSTPAA